MNKKGYFEGEYRRRPAQNLAGASKQHVVSELINKAQCLRRQREVNRLEVEKATVIQAAFRGADCRKHVKFQLKINLTNKIDELNLKLKQPQYLNLDDIKCLLRYIRFIYPRDYFWRVTTVQSRQDCDKLVYITNVVRNYKLMIIQAIIEDNDWLWRIIYFLYLNLNFIKTFPLGYETRIPTLLMTIKDFLDPNIYVKFEHFKDTANVLKIIWEKLLSNGLFKSLIVVVDNKYSIPYHLFYSKSLSSVHYLFGVMFQWVSLPENINFRQVALKLLAEEVICKDMLINTKRLVFPAIKRLEKFPLQAVSEIILSSNDENLFTIHALHNFLCYFDSEETTESAKDLKTYLTLLSKLTINMPLLDKYIKSQEGKIVILGEQREILNDCWSLFNCSIKTEKWINLLHDILQRNDHNELYCFCKCIYHFWISDRPPVYKYHLIQKIAFHPHFLKQLWMFITEERRILSFSSPAYSATILGMLSSGIAITPIEADRIMPALTMFCFLLKNNISLLSDELLYEEELHPEAQDQNKFTLRDIKSICPILKELAVGIISLAFPSITIHGVDQRIDFSTPTKHLEFNTLAWRTLLEQIVSLLRLLHDRDSRRQFATFSGYWISSTLQDLNHSLTQFKNVDSVTPFSSTPDCVYRAFAVYENRFLTTIRTVPFTISFLKRFTLYQSYIAESKLEFQDPGMHFLQVPYLLAKIRRDYLYEDAFEKIYFEPDLRIHLKVHLVSSLGVEEPGIDGGGLFREFIMEFLKSAFDPNRGFFILNRDNEFYPNPNVYMICTDFRTHYFFIGKMLGKALFENVLVEVPFADFFLSEIIEHTNELYINGLATLDPDLYKNLISLICYEGDLYELGLDFTLTLNDFGESVVVELKQDGRNIHVNQENVLEYVYLVAKFKVHTQIKEQAACFFTGLSSVIPLEWIRMFSTREIQLIISGNKSPIDVNDMKAFTVYSGGYSPEHPTIIMFWNVMSSFDNQQKSLLLKFVTSCSRPPLLGFKELYPPLCIQLVDCDANRLPSSSTCMNILKLPEFTSEAIMKEKLLYAIQSGSGFELI